MCRLAVYMGPPLLLAHFVTEPKHGIIVQSEQAIEASVQLNGDGFGVSWYVPEITKRPALFREVTPAWSNENLRELSNVIISSCVFVHVRKASTGSQVTNPNCHPFTHKKFSFMHNGGVGNFHNLRKRFTEMLSDESYKTINGSTDSEHLFALFLDHYKEVKQNCKKEGKYNKLETMAAALCKVISSVEELIEDFRKTNPEGEDKDLYLSLLNLVVSDGNNIVATRYTTGELHGAHTLFYCTGQKFQLHKEEKTAHIRGSSENIKQKETFQEHEKMVIVASEPLTDADDFKEIPPNYIVLASRDSIALKSIDKLRAAHPNVEK